MTHLILASVGINICCGLAAALLGRFALAATLMGVLGAVGASLVGLGSATEVLLRGTAESIHFTWTIPYGAFEVGLDSISAFFLIPIFFFLPWLQSMVGLTYFLIGIGRV